MSEIGMVRVRFVDESSGALLGEVSIPASRLPSRFEVETMLRLGDDDWLVVHADPPSADQYLAQSALKLTLRHVRAAPDAEPTDRAAQVEIPPTRSGTMPALGDPIRETRGVELNENDWRQIELLSLDACDAAKVEIAAIDRVLHDVDLSFAPRVSHVRTTMNQPLCGVTLDPAMLRDVFGAAIPLTFGPEHRAVENGFAFRAPGGLIAYGIASNRGVEVLGLRGSRESSGTRDREVLASFRKQHQLAFVDWCARVLIKPPA